MKGKILTATFPFTVAQVSLTKKYEFITIKIDSRLVVLGKKLLSEEFITANQEVKIFATLLTWTAPVSKIYGKHNAQQRRVDEELLKTRELIGYELLVLNTLEKIWISQGEFKILLDYQK